MRYKNEGSKSQILPIRLDLSVEAENQLYQWYKSIPASRRQEYIRNVLLSCYKNDLQLTPLVISAKKTLPVESEPEIEVSLETGVTNTPIQPAESNQIKGFF